MGNGVVVGEAKDVVAGTTELQLQYALIFKKACAPEVIPAR